MQITNLLYFRLYFEICDGIFLNYNWTEEKLKESKLLADNRYLDIYVGIDVFGRGCYGGGGFNTPSVKLKYFNLFSNSKNIFLHLIGF